MIADADKTSVTNNIIWNMYYVENKPQSEGWSLFYNWEVCVVFIMEMFETTVSGQCI